MRRLLLFIILLPSLVIAESLKISGVGFDVDQLEKVDQNFTKITLFSETKIVDDARLEDYVLTQYFARTENISKISVADLENFIINSTTAGNTIRAYQALYAASLHSDVKEKDFLVFIEKLMQVKESLDVFKSIISFSQGVFFSAAVASEVLYSAGIQDPKWLKEEVALHDFKNWEYLDQYVVKKFQENIHNENYNELPKIINFIANIYGENSSLYQRYSSIHSNVLQALAYSKDGQIEGLYTLMDQSKDDNLLKIFLSPLFVKTLHRQAQDRLKQNNPQLALNILTRVDINKRTPTTHQLVQQALSASPVSANSAIANLQIELMLRSLAEKDSAIKAAYIKALEDHVRFFLSEENFERAQEFSNKIYSIRPEASLATDRLNLEFTYALLKAGDRRAAKNKFAEIKSEVGMFEGLNLAFSGFYINKFLLIGLCLCPFLIALLVAFRYRQEFVFADEGAQSSDKNDRLQAQQEQEPQADMAGGGFKKRGITIAPPDFSMEEYRTYLAKFDLEPGVDAKAIKVAYRNAVKEYHPDLNNNNESEAASEKFIELTMAYEKLIELEKKARGES